MLSAWKLEIYSYLLKYLELKQLKVQRKSKSYSMVECCKCRNQPLSGHFLPKINLYNCFVCKQKFTIIDCVRELEQDKVDFSDDKIYDYLIDLFKIQVVTDNDKSEIETVFDFYESCKFEFTPLAKGTKDPVKGSKWTEKGYKDPQDWQHWQECGLNMAVICGERSKLTLIDIDVAEIPKEILDTKEDCLMQKTDRGWHLLFKYEPDLGNWKNMDLKIECRNNGSLTTLFPSKIDNNSRQFIGELKLIKMPEKLKEYLLTIKQTRAKTDDTGKIVGSDYRCPLIGDGEGRNELITHLAGRFSKFMPQKGVQKALLDVNRTICKEGEELSSTEIYTIANSIEQYRQFDQDDLSSKVLEVLTNSEELSQKDIELIAFGEYLKGEAKQRLNKVLLDLIRGFRIKKNRSYYKIIHTVRWEESLMDTSKPITEFKIPYFDDYAYFQYGDVIVIGSIRKYGKTHLCMNFIKRLIAQNVKPYYSYTESGSRFKKVALQLGLKDNDFYFAPAYDYKSLTLEKNSVTIFDWLDPSTSDDFAKTSKIFRELVYKSEVANGFLVVIVQLKMDGSWFAENMLGLYPALSVKYLRVNKDDRFNTHFVLSDVRETKNNIYDIPCRYNDKSKEVMMIDELEDK